MRYRLRTLLIVMAVGPPVIAGVCATPLLREIVALYIGMLIFMALLLATCVAVERQIENGE